MEEIRYVSVDHSNQIILSFSAQYSIQEESSVQFSAQRHRIIKSKYKSSLILRFEVEIEVKTEVEIEVKIEAKLVVEIISLFRL